jgi:hypothetical protein
MKKSPNHPFALGALTLSLAALFTACSRNATPPGAESGNPTPLAEELESLQGYWEGEGAGGKCSITIVGNSLHYRNSGGWFKTTFTLPAGTDPRQLHATIKECSPPSDSAICTVVYAIYKIEDGTLTLAEFDGSDKPPKTFEGNSSRYTVRKVQPQTKKAEASTSGGTRPTAMHGSL